MQSKFIKNVSFTECPICHSKMHVFQGKSLVCRQKHCFDIAKQGYVNFNPGKSTSYPADLFANRQKVFSNEFYQPLAKHIEDLIVDLCDNPNPLILDAGCGEGYYSKTILPHSICNKLSFDISKEAIQLAAKGSDAALWMVASLDNIPVKSNSVDVILDILTPANYAEFNRVLKKNGIIIKVVPCTNYLIELRKLAIDQIKNKEYDNIDVLEYFKSHTHLIKQTLLSYILPVNKELAVLFAKMTPMMMAVDIDKLHLDSLHSITIELDVLVAKKLD